MNIYPIVKQLLFQLSAEKAHDFSLSQLNSAVNFPLFKTLMGCPVGFPIQEVRMAGLTFPHPVGLAAGLDKNAIAFEAMSKLGFSFVEVGTVTPKPQAGNPQPRLFRLPKDQALINRMGFNNDGVDAIAERLAKRHATKGLIIGGNIGKNKSTPNESAVDDYLICFDRLKDLVDYFTVNISSPNTPDLRALQDKEPLKKLLESLKNAQAKASVHRPIFLKIAPDLNKAQLDDIIEIILELSLEGLIGTNTTISRSGLSSNPQTITQIGAGGLSGKPLSQSATAIIKYIHEQTEGQVPIIASGGIMSAEDAQNKMKAGAKLVQLYTGFVYHGPKLIADILKS